MTMREYLQRWILHKSAYLITEKKLTGTITFSGLMHDWEKPILMFFLRDKKKVQKIHRKHSKHHVRDSWVEDPMGAIIDWECARMTKPEMQLNARETLDKYYPKCLCVEWILIDLENAGIL